ncbi:DNA recombination protein RmuC [Tibeticola sp.]|uniref:DNA recombination protein RmuC n=1 Tax=Tibeticola sp. TaxID=2005368 RepID=UPI002589EED4|nr:DNA recombination protein RmuC [Tibeticola sp.]MCI4441310.1 DNA recombination protein RmuC [Tibeticola sp.]
MLVSELWLWGLSLALVVALSLLMLLLWRRPRVDLPPEWAARLQAMEQAVQDTRLAVAQNGGVLDAMADQVRSASQASGAQAEALRAVVDERLAQAVAESRNGRAELLTAFAGFEVKLEQRLASFDAALAQRLAALETALAQRLATMDAALAQSLAASRADLSGALAAMSAALKDQLEASSSQLRQQFGVLQDGLQQQSSVLQQGLSQQLSALVQGSQANAEQLRTALNERLAAIQADNTAKLEEMRRTVDEKLHATLEQRLGDSFKLVSERLEQVHKGLGEMQSLAGSVGDLKRVMTNVKTRGTWGEVQLGAIIDNVLTPEQYARNVKVAPGSDELVEFAIRLPGRRDEQPVWLPIDAKYPVEHYQRLMDAQDSADRAAIMAAGTAFENSLRFEAKKIASKYIAPPHTTDFAILYLPTEGLFAEALRRPGLMEALQNEHRVMVCGPANLAAMLNSLQMGFKTLAIEKRSSEVWAVLGQVKTEFMKFGDALDAAKKSIDTAAKKFDDVGVRTRAIQRKLRDVQELPAPESPAGLDPQALLGPAD